MNEVGDSSFPEVLTKTLTTPKITYLAFLFLSLSLDMMTRGIFAVEWKQAQKGNDVFFCRRNTGNNDMLQVTHWHDRRSRNIIVTVTYVLICVIVYLPQVVPVRPQTR